MFWSIIYLKKQWLLFVTVSLPISGRLDTWINMPWQNLPHADGVIPGGQFICFDSHPAFQQTMVPD
jgi:hypothetical protein